MAQPTEDDLHAALAEVESGRYRTAELLPAYTAWAEKNGREVPTVKELGQAISRELCLDRDKGHGNVAVWIVTPEGINCRNWFTPTS